MGLLVDGRWQDPPSGPELDLQAAQHMGGTKKKEETLGFLLMQGNYM